MFHSLGPVKENALHPYFLHYFACFSLSILLELVVNNNAFITVPFQLFFTRVLAPCQSSQDPVSILLQLRRYSIIYSIIIYSGI